MNISEANALNRVLDWLADLEAGERSESPFAMTAADQLVWLAGRANKALGAGHSVSTASERVVPKLLEHREQARRALAGLAAAQESDGAAQAVCRAIQSHLAHNGSLPWPSIRRPFEEWQTVQTVQAAEAGE